MARIRDLKGVAHDLVAHGESALSWLHPHVGNYARQAGVEEFTIDVLQGSEPHVTVLLPKPLRLASESLRAWFQPVLSSYGFNLQDLASAKLTFGAFGSDPFVFATRASVVAASGRKFSYERGWPPKTSQ